MRANLDIPPEALAEIVRQVADLLPEGRQHGDDGWLRGAEKIAAYIDAPVSRVYALAATKPPRIPIEHDGSSLVAKRSALDAWITSGGGTRP